MGCSKPEEVISSRISLANQKLEAGDVAASIDILERLSSRYPDRPSVIEALGFAYARRGDDAAAAAAFVRAADLDPASAVLRQIAAEAFLKSGAPARAAEQHRLYLAEFPGDFQSWQKLGAIEEQRGDLARAIDAYLEWYRLRPDGTCAFRLGTAFRRLNNAPQAKAWFEATIKHGDSHIEDALLGLLELELEAGDLAAAARTVGQLDRNFPDALDASRLAGVRQRIAAWREAEDALAAARAEQERLARELAAAREARARPEPIVVPATEPPPPTVEDTPPTSIQPARTPPALPPEPPSATIAATNTSSATELPRSEQLLAAIQRRESGDVQGAIDLLWRALGESPGDVALWVEAADCYRALRQSAPAEACILEARRLAPDSVEVETAYLNIVRESQPSEVYLARVDAARTRFPDNANLAWVFAVELAANEGDAARTIAAYEDFLLLADPADPRRAEAAQFLARARR
ncbi:tetratricopeptide repeat protein [Congregicoccus parvus]|uniref:tetratricopeptide repeat protein n=1 Tax=Congregicoccus parvus TaxID=3081749 RepID=UPI003FA52C09